MPIRLVFFGSAAIGETGAKWLAGIFLTVVYTAGSMLVMWIGERITEYGVSNGISLIWLYEKNTLIIIWGAEIIANAKMRGITPEPEILMGITDDCPLLIVVSVAMELDKQLESQLMMKNYKGFLK